MAIDERTRHEVHVAFEELWGPERAEAIMSLLPPVGWGEVATKRDLDALEHSIRHEFRTEMAGLRTDLADVRTEFHRDLSAATRTMVFSLTSSVFVVGGLAFAAARLA